MKKPPRPSPALRRRKVAAARALHDGLCQTLTGLHLLTNVLTQQAKKADPRLGKEMDELQVLVERARAECNEVLLLLREIESGKSARKPAR